MAECQENKGTKLYFCKEWPSAKKIKVRNYIFGRVAEWLKARAWKVRIGSKALSRVQIPSLPPISFICKTRYISKLMKR